MSFKMNIKVSHKGELPGVTEIALPRLVQNLKNLHADVTAAGAKISITATVDVQQDVPGRDGDEILRQHVGMLFGVPPENCARRNDGSFAVKLIG